MTWQGPFQLLNFDGTKRDVAVLAHESGHGSHFLLSYQQGYLQYHPPLTLAETGKTGPCHVPFRKMFENCPFNLFDILAASIFGEMIVFRDLLEISKTPEERLALLMSKIDDVVNSVVRQCSFDFFEEMAHSARENGELSSDELDTFWKRAIEEYYGKARDEGGDSPFDSYQDTEHLWSYVPHFHHVPFYVYSVSRNRRTFGELCISFEIIH